MKGIGGAEGDRTPDLRIANATLSQLSYGPDRSRDIGALAQGGADYREAAVPCQARHRGRLRTPAGNGTVGRSLPPWVLFMGPLIALIHTVIWIYIYLLIAQAVLSWLLAFGVVNRYNRAISMIGDFLWRISEPLLRPIRRIIPDLGGIDISPMILILLLWFLDSEISNYFG